MQLITIPTGPNKTQVYKVETTPRGGIVAVRGKLLLSVDYKGQEIATAAAYSKDAIMETSLLAPAELTLEDGTQYDNPDADLHTMTAVNVCFRQQLSHFPKHEWVKKAKDKDVYKNAKGEPARQISKKVNFTEIYLASAQTLADLLNIPLETAKEWAGNFQETYCGYYDWAQNLGKIAEIRGYARTLWYPRVRWVAESNAKGAGESPLRSAVNFMIQGECANQLKVSLVRLDRYLWDKQAHLLETRPQALTEEYWVSMLPPVHDEMIFEIPGEAYLDEEKSEWKGDVLTKIKYKYSDEALDWSRQISSIIKDTQTECFDALESPVRGAVDTAMAPFWAH